MSAVLLGMNVSLDGYVATLDGDNDWLFANRDDELDATTDELLGGLDAVLIGRVLYEEMAAYWPSARGRRAEIMNRVTKVVFSRTLAGVEWENARLATGAAAEEIARLKRQTGGDIGVAGGARFAQLLSRERLIDRYRLTVHPVALGRGKPLFADEIRLRLLESRTFPGGAMVNTYTPA
jgi:dihydrofolate reductase